MSEFEDKLSSILNDPARMEQITAMAKSLMGERETPKESAAEKAAAVSGPDFFNPAMLGRMPSILQSMQVKDEKQVLLHAMKPYLSSGRQEKLERAMRLAKMIHMAELAFGAFGGVDDAKI